MADVVEIDSGVASPDRVAVMEELIDTNDDARTALMSAIAGKNEQTIIEKDDDDDCDETFGERIWGLTEMFPEKLRSASSYTCNCVTSTVGWSYKFSRQAIWFGFSTSLILFGPLMFELERFNMEEMAKQDRNRLVLGPGTAMSGSPPAGMTQ